MIVYSSVVLVEGACEIHWLLRRRRTRLKQVAVGLFLLFVLYKLDLFSVGSTNASMRDDVMDMRLKRYYDYQRTPGERKYPRENDALVPLTAEEQNRAGREEGSGRKRRPSSTDSGGAESG